jgi:hypothetical protein
VIEYVSAVCDQAAYSPVFLQTVVGGIQFFSNFPIPIGVSSPNEAAFSGVVKIYADPGTNVTVSVLNGICNVNISGQLVNSP